MKLSFICEYVIKIWFSIDASDRENHLKIFINQSRSMLGLHVRDISYLKMFSLKH